MARASRAAPAPMASTTRKPVCDGTDAVPTVVVSYASATPVIAPDSEMPMARMSVLRLLAAAVSDTCTAAMTREGMAP